MHPNILTQLASCVSVLRFEGFNAVDTEVMVFRDVIPSSLADGLLIVHV